MKKLLPLLLLLSVISSCSLFQSKKPAPTPPVVVTPDPEPTPEPTPEPEPEEEEERSEGPMAIARVDSYFSNDELSKKRANQQTIKEDFCHSAIPSSASFAEVISFYVTDLSGGMQVLVNGIAPYYNMKSDPTKYEKVGLITHPLCRVTSSTLSQTIKKQPDASTVVLANKFSEDHNTLLKAGKKKELRDLWGRFFGCLAYTESLSTADTPASYNVAKKYGPSGYSKPPGVKFYEDPSQDEASKLNIGLFQFTPRYSGNINPCVKQWNERYSCGVESTSQSHLIKVVGSSMQKFNAFCGVHKLLQTFTVQLESSSNRNTHPDNFGKPKSERCVTPHIWAGWGYNHFGPLQNSTGTNLGKLMRCVYPGN